MSCSNKFIPEFPKGKVDDTISSLNKTFSNRNIDNLVTAIKMGDAITLEYEHTYHIEKIYGDLEKFYSEVEKILLMAGYNHRLWFGKGDIFFGSNLPPIIFFQ